MLGEGLGSMVNNPKFARMCNPVDTEFEINVCDELANLLNLHEDFLYSRNGVGIINANEGDSVLSLIITAKFLKRSLQGEAIATSDKYIVYASNREVMSGIKRICQTCDVTLRIFNNLEELTKMIEDDKLENLHPLFILYDLYFGNQEKYENETEKIGEICKNDNIWFHINLGHFGCFAMLDECKYLTQDLKNIVDSFSIEASKYFEVSYESSILWSKNRDRIYEGMHWSTECEQKFQYLSDKHTYTVDFKNFQVYLGKMNRAYKFWFVLNMYGTNAMKNKMAEHFENFTESSK